MRHVANIGKKTGVLVVRIERRNRFEIMALNGRIISTGF
jgi:hypothetical protein